MRYLKSFFYNLIQCTWGALQTAFGFCFFLKYIKCKHEFYHGSILTYHNGDWGGVSLGTFIFVNGNRGEQWIKDAKVHEYGHTIQSLLLGPLYLFVIGIPSAIWCNNKKFNELRESGKATYYDFYPESGANTLGAWTTKEPIPLWEHNLAEMARQKELNKQLQASTEKHSEK